MTAIRVPYGHKAAMLLGEILHCATLRMSVSPSDALLASTDLYYHVGLKTEYDTVFSNLVRVAHERNMEEPCDCGCHIPGLLPIPDCCSCRQ